MKTNNNEESWCIILSYTVWFNVIVFGISVSDILGLNVIEIVGLKLFDIVGFMVL